MMGILGALSETGYLVPLLLCVLGAAKTGVLVVVIGLGSDITGVVAVLVVLIRQVDVVLGLEVLVLNLHAILIG